jgi:hypothetical protein
MPNWTIHPQISLCNLAVAICVLTICPPIQAEVIVPGTGRHLPQVGDNFEDEHWQYELHAPKSTRDQDQQERLPAGESANRRWYEGMKRGQPDIVRRVPTPPGGLPESTAALLLQSFWTGVPGRPSYRLGQDDLIADVNYRLGGAIPVAHCPNVVVRVFLPPVDSWEERSGPHFGFRAALTTTVAKPAGQLQFSAGVPQEETYWAGIFIEFQSRTDGYDDDYAHFRLRADRNGNDFQSQPVTTTGWWTLGFSITPDGMVHYFARPGVGELRPEDRLASQFPYGYRAQYFKTFFFNVCNLDDGRTWSTAWIVDDPMVFVAH